MTEPPLLAAKAEPPLLAAPLERTVPWSLTEARAAATALIAGISLIGWGWWVSSGTARPRTAVLGIALAVLGIVATSGGAASWLASGRRSVRVRRSGLLARIEALPVDSAPGAHVAADRLVRVPGSTRYHRADCLLVQGKNVRAATDGKTDLTTLIACEMCEPEREA